MALIADNRAGIVLNQAPSEEFRRVVKSFVGMRNWRLADGQRNESPIELPGADGVLIEVFRDSVDLTYHSAYFAARHTVRLNGASRGYRDRLPIDSDPVFTMTVSLSQLTAIAERREIFLNPSTPYDGLPVDPIDTSDIHWSILGNRETLRALVRARRVLPKPSEYDRWGMNVVELARSEDSDRALVHAATPHYATQGECECQWDPRGGNLCIEADVIQDAYKLHFRVKYAREGWLRAHRYGFLDGVGRRHRTTVMVGDSVWVADGYGPKYPDVRRMFSNVECESSPSDWLEMDADNLVKALEAAAKSMAASKSNMAKLTLSCSQLGKSLEIRTNDDAPTVMPITLAYGNGPGSIHINPTQLASLIKAVKRRSADSRVSLCWYAEDRPIRITGMEGGALLMPMDPSAPDVNHKGKGRKRATKRATK